MESSPPAVNRLWCLISACCSADFVSLHLNCKYFDSFPRCCRLFRRLNLLHLHWCGLKRFDWNWDEVGLALVRDGSCLDGWFLGWGRVGCRVQQTDQQLFQSSCSHRQQPHYSSTSCQLSKTNFSHSISTNAFELHWNPKSFHGHPASCWRSSCTSFCHEWSFGLSDHLQMILNLLTCWIC